MFECPKCNTPVPRWKSAIMTNYTKIDCENCGARLKPDIDALKNLTIVGVVILFFVARTAFNLFGLGGMIITLLLGFLAACVATVRKVTFEVIEDEIIAE